MGITEQPYFTRLCSQHFIICVVSNESRHVCICQDVLNERMKLYKVWKDVEVSLSKKKDEQTRLEQQRKTDKLAVVTREISEVETCCAELILRLSVPC